MNGLSNLGGPVDDAEAWASLSSREQRVAALVADGLSNRAIAEQLFMSRHTVDYHLRHIFVKLGIHSRVRLTRVIAELHGPS